MYENICLNLVYLRNTRIPPYTQRELAQKLHVSRNTYRRYEKGLRIPPLWFLNDVAKFYNIELKELISEDLRKGENIKNEDFSQGNKKKN